MSRATQCERLLNLLKSHEGDWVSLPEIMALQLASHTRRIFELRQSLKLQGYQIEIKSEWPGPDERHTWYKLSRIQPQLTVDDGFFAETDALVQP